MTAKKIRDVVKKMGISIRSEREKRDLSVSDLCQAAGISYTTLWRIENGKSGCTMEAFIRLLIALEITTVNF